MPDPITAFLERTGCKRQAYLGRGLYVGHDGRQVWLVTEREHGLHYVALDGPVRACLQRYLRSDRSKRSQAQMRATS